MYDYHDGPDYVGATIGATIFIGGCVVLACTAWAWAVRVEVLHGTFAGAALAGVVGLLNGVIIGSQTSRTRRREFSFAAHALFSIPTLLLAVVGGIVGIFTNLI